MSASADLRHYYVWRKCEDRRLAWDLELLKAEVARLRSLVELTRKPPEKRTIKAWSNIVDIEP